MKKYLSFLFGWCLIIACLVFSVRTWALDPHYYSQKYEDMHLAESLGVSQKDLNKSITVLLDYLNDGRSDIKVEIHKDGKTREAFDRRETLHMIDVKALYQNTLKAGYICLIGGIILALYLLHEKNGLAYITKGINRASLCFLLFIAFLAIWIATDFTDFWTHFHHVFFRNDYWLLTPGVDFMIDMLPETVFYTLVVRIVITIVVILGTINVFCLYYQKHKAPIGFEVEK